jgi:hypothetical protein
LWLWDCASDLIYPRAVRHIHVKKKPKTLEVSHERDRLYVLEMQVDIQRYQTCYVKCTKDRLILWIDFHIHIILLLLISVSTGSFSRRSGWSNHRLKIHENYDNVNVWVWLCQGFGTSWPPMHLDFYKPTLCAPCPIKGTPKHYWSSRWFPGLYFKYP